MDHEGQKLLNHAYDHQKELGQMASERDLLLFGTRSAAYGYGTGRGNGLAIWRIWVWIFIFI